MNLNGHGTSPRYNFPIPIDLESLWENLLTLGWVETESVETESNKLLHRFFTLGHVKTCSIQMLSDHQTLCFCFYRNSRHECWRLSSQDLPEDRGVVAMMVAFRLTELASQ